MNRKPPTGSPPDKRLTIIFGAAFAQATCLCAALCLPSQSTALLVAFPVSVLISVLALVHMAVCTGSRYQLLKRRCIERLHGLHPEKQMGGFDHFARIDEVLSEAQQDWVSLVQKDYTLLENLAVEAERKRIREDINSLVLPCFRNIKSLSPTGSDQCLSELARQVTELEAGITDILSEIHPPGLADTGLVPSIITLTDRFRRASRIETMMIADIASGSPNLNVSLDEKFAIYRVTQEALNNIEKHSGATLARVAVKLRDECLFVLIEDNGRGFQETRSTQSRGLKNIRERAAAIGASVTWQKSAEFAQGTLVTISLQLCGTSIGPKKPESKSILKNWPEKTAPNSADKIASINTEAPVN